MKSLTRQISRPAASFSSAASFRTNSNFRMIRRLRSLRCRSRDLGLPCYSSSRLRLNRLELELVHSLTAALKGFYSGKYSRIIAIVHFDGTDDNTDSSNHDFGDDYVHWHKQLANENSINMHRFNTICPIHWRVSQFQSRLFFLNRVPRLSMIEQEDGIIRADIITQRKE